MSSYNDRGGHGRGGGGRGAYYKNKYGNRGKAGRGGQGRGNFGEDHASNGRSSYGNDNGNVHAAQIRISKHSDLINRLHQIDGKSYHAYHDIEGSWEHDKFSLSIGRTQSDPFAPPTRCRINVPSSTVGLPSEAYSNKTRRVACGDFINRVLYDLCCDLRADQSLSGGVGGWNGPKGGDIKIMLPGQYVLEQSAVVVTTDGDIIAQFTVNLPARGRTILGEKARDIFDHSIVSLVQKSLIYKALNSSSLKRHILDVEDQTWLRSQLDSNGLVAFVADGSLLPRRSGVDDRPFAPSKDQVLVCFKVFIIWCR